MTWNETHERTRIIREVEAAAAADMSGALPWREEWSQYFATPAVLVEALRARWNHMCEAQLDTRANEDEVRAAYTRLRRTHAGVLAIIAQADAGVELTARLVAPIPTAVSHARRRLFQFHGGPVLPS
ncbi:MULTISPECIES: hypothetical protein [unclassified Nocardioides]|jgi:hypothetical protein|uniref:hypothetical protein n=1 Tax=unclassified Nocardioides TaxID=2615069 RepID=UPI00070242DB|nr:MULTISPECIES: hypothetical protein [unclassified Nocardioides]KRC53216.1 hypothetical protein ASE19_12695 [Nocardioides sp. Root79]KRC70553.1 hypothetical protein ASE20_11540 [Nocardioides sp. Root240]